MATSCDFKTAEASTKAWMRTNGLIDKFLNILDLKRFREKNTELSDRVRELYNIEERLFMEEGGGKKAVPNTKVFHQIDAAKDVFYPENEYLREVEIKPVSDQMVQDFMKNCKG